MTEFGFCDPGNVFEPLLEKLQIRFSVTNAFVILQPGINGPSRAGCLHSGVPTKPLVQAGFPERQRAVPLEQNGVFEGAPLEETNGEHKLSQLLGWQVQVDGSKEVHRAQLHEVIVNPHVDEVGIVVVGGDTTYHGAGHAVLSIIGVGITLGISDDIAC